MEQKEGITEDQNGLLEPFDLTPHEDIQAAALAMGVVEELDPMLLDEADEFMLKEIRKMAMIITYQALYEIYEANMYGPKDNQSA